MSLIADDFIWWTDAAGYRVIAERSNPNAPSLLEGAQRAEHVRSGGGKRVEYSPTKKFDQLYKTFVNIKTSDDVLRFIRLYGTLTENGSRMGEEVSVVLKHAAAFRDWLAVPPNRKRLAEGLGKTGLMFASLKARLAVDRNGMLSLQIVPKDLLSALWLHLAETLASGEATIRACLQCGAWFEVGRGRPRRLDAKFCSDEHRVLYNSLRRSQEV
jgi:hypothetical protein